MSMTGHAHSLPAWPTATSVLYGRTACVWLNVMRDGDAARLRSTPSFGRPSADDGRHEASSRLAPPALVRPPAAPTTTTCLLASIFLFTCSGGLDRLLGLHSSATGQHAKSQLTPSSHSSLLRLSSTCSLLLCPRDIL